MRVLSALAACSLLCVGIASLASAVTLDWTDIGYPGNACNNNAFGCNGAVGYAYQIGTYEVTNAQYTEFLNAKAASDPFGLYNAAMADPANHYPIGFSPCCNTGEGGITRSGTAGSYSYSAIPGRENMPVNFVDYLDGMRFANWVSNGQGNGDTETGSYTLLGGTAIPTNARSVTRNPSATIFLPSENEWYKAAYYDPSTAGYFDYPTGPYPICSGPTSAPGHANCARPYDGPTPIGSYPGSPSRFAVFDLAGNVMEWTDTITNVDSRDLRGGSYVSDGNASHRETNGWGGPGVENNAIGFRLAMIPEPGTGLLVCAGLLGLAGWRRVRA